MSFSIEAESGNVLATEQGATLGTEDVAVSKPTSGVTTLPGVSADQFARRIGALFPRGWSSDDAKQSGNVYSLFASVGTELVAIVDQLRYALSASRLQTSTSPELDLASADFFGSAFPRPSGLSDTDYAKAIIARLFRPANTREALFAALVDLCGQAPRMFEPWSVEDTGWWGDICYWGVDTVDNPSRWGNGSLRYQGFIETTPPQIPLVGPNNPVLGWGSAAYWNVPGYFFGIITTTPGTAVYDLINDLKAEGTLIWTKLVPPGGMAPTPTPTQTPAPTSPPIITDALVLSEAGSGVDTLARAVLKALAEQGAAVETFSTSRSAVAVTLTDSATPTDNVLPSSPNSFLQTEAASAADTISSATTKLQALAESVSAADATGTTTARAYADSVTTADAFSSVTFALILTEPTSAADTAAPSLQSNAQVLSDTTVAVDAAVGTNPNSILLSDQAVTADSVSILSARTANAAETATAVDSPALSLTKATVETGAANEQISAFTVAVTLSEQATATDTVAGTQSGVRSITDTASAADAVAIASVLLVENATAVDALSVLGAGTAAIVEPAAAVDTPTGAIAQAYTDVLSAADIPAASTFVAALTDRATAVDTSALSFQSGTRTLPETAAVTDLVVGNLTNAVLLSDQALGGDAVSGLTQRSSAVIEVSSAVDTTAIGIAVAAVETGAAVEALAAFTVAVALTEQGTATDAPAASQTGTRTIADAATAVDLGVVSSNWTVLVSDTATAVDVPAPLTVRATSLAEAGAAVDHVATALTETLSDTLAATDAFNSANTSGTVPSAVTNLAVSTTSTTATLTWGAPTTGYPTNYAYTLFYRVSDPSNTTTFTSFSTVSSSPGQITGLQSNVAYDFEVIVRNSAGQTPSGIVTATTLKVLPGPAQNLAVSSIGATTLTLSWQAPATGTPPFTYYAQYRVTGTSNWTQASVAGNYLSLVITGLQPNTEYDLEVVTSNAGSSSSPTYSVVMTEAASASEAITVTTSGTAGNVLPGGSTNPAVSVPLTGTVTTNGRTYASYNGMYYSFIKPANYDSTKRYPLLLYMHQNDNGQPIYTSNGDTSQDQYVGPYVETWFNNTNFQTNFPCFVIAPLLNQSSDTSGEHSNFGGYDGTVQIGQTNCINIIKQFVANYPIDTSRIYVTGASMGGSGTIVDMLTYNTINGTSGGIFAAGLAMSGVDYDAGGSTPNASVVTQMRAGVPLGLIHGSTDTDQPATYFSLPLWQDLGGSGTPSTWTRAGTTNCYLLVDPNLGHDVWDNYYGWPQFQSYANWLFSFRASGSASLSGASPNGATATPGSGSITDASGNVWTVTTGGVVALNGATTVGTSGVTEIAYVNGQVWQENNQGTWWYWDGSTWQPNGGTTTSPLAGASTGTGTPNMRDTMLSWLNGLVGKATISVQQLRGQTGDDGANGLAYVYQQAGVYPGGLGGNYYNNDDHAYVAGGQSYAAINTSAPNQALITHWNAGGIVLLSGFMWPGPDVPHPGGAAYPGVSGTVNGADLVTPGTATYNNLLATLDDVAAGMQDLVNNGVGVILFRPWHEMQGNWFWWGTGISDAQYKQLWQITYNYLGTTKGLAKNLIWIYAACASGGSGSADARYPGDAYVDIVGWDDYTNTPASSIQADSSVVQNIKKPTAYCEWGPSSGPVDETVIVNAIKNANPSPIYWEQWSIPGWAISLQNNIKAALTDPYVLNRSNINRPSGNTPGQPTNLTLTSIGTTTATLTWSAPTTGAAVTSYTIKAATGFAASASGTVLTNNAYSIVDTAGNVWTIDSNGEAACNGTDIPTANVIGLAYINGTVWQVNSSAQWYTFSVSNGVGANSGGPYTTPSYASPNNTTITTAGAGIIDGSGNVWGISTSQQVIRNGTVDTSTSGVAQLAYVNGKVWQQNTAGNWYQFSAVGSWPGPSASPLSGGAVSAPQPISGTTKQTGAWNTVGTSTTTTGTATGLTSGTAYQFEVIANGASGSGLPSATVSGTTKSS